MASMFRATKRVRNTKGSSYLTHGSDNYDHKGLKKARRLLDRAVIDEQLDTDDFEPAPTKTDTTFRIVLRTQCYENYGAHCWDGTGECPQHWKAKGGNEYQRQIGDANQVIELGKAGIEKHLAEMTKIVNSSDEYYQEYAINWEIIPSTEETCEESDLREMFEWGSFGLNDSEREALYASRLNKLQSGI